MVDGEAGAEDLSVLRAHVRTCLACRARLRDYRTAPARVAALVPPVAGLPLLAPLRDVWHSSSAWLHERAAGLAVRWHATLEAAAAHKVAAVTASTAVLASGGAATVATIDAEPDRTRARPAVTQRAEPTRSRPPAPPTRTADRQASVPRATPRVRPSSPQPQSSEPVPTPPPSRGEFDLAPEASTSRSPTRSEPDSPSSPPAGEGGEFAP